MSLKKGQGQFRIIAGQWRGRKFPVADREGLRPTTDRVRETLFNWLQFDIPGATVLDLFAGSGSLGFEAASRGARQVVLIEKDKHAALQLSDNMSRLDSDTLGLLEADALQVLAQPQRLPKSIDVVFIDPPFHQGLAEQALNILQDANFLSAQSLVYLEVEQQAVLELTPHWDILREKKHGAVRFLLLQRKH
ncbi:MAG: 16S rRNA (guanine(966)-N(2))-methyltransferase RsmD [Pseudomonadota bacterium]